SSQGSRISPITFSRSGFGDPPLLPAIRRAALRGSAPHSPGAAVFPKWAWSSYRALSRSGPSMKRWTCRAGQSASTVACWELLYRDSLKILAGGRKPPRCRGHAGSRLTRVFSSEVDTGSREENTSKQRARDPVLIQSEPERL